MDAALEYTDEEKAFVARIATFVHGRGNVAGAMKHPLMEALRARSLSKEQLRKFCDVRYNAASEFVPLLEQAITLATTQGKTNLAKVLTRNWRDETGYDRDSGEKFSTPNAHSDWRKDSLDAMNVETTHSNHFPLYRFTDEDDLPTLVGMLLGAEMVIPREDDRMLKALSLAMPNRFHDMRECDHSPNNLGEIEYNRLQRNSLYFADHIEHDAKRHMPELVRAVFQDFTEQERQTALQGAERFFAERSGLYDFIQQKIGVERSVGAARDL